jgi:hypothetical protein
MDEINDEINIEALLLHSAAFGLYLISIVVYGVFYVIYLTDVQNSAKEEQMLCANIAYFVCSFIAQCLLIAIFWQLGVKEELDDSVVPV